MLKAMPLAVTPPTAALATLSQMLSLPPTVSAQGVPSGREIGSRWITFSEWLNFNGCAPARPSGEAKTPLREKALLSPWLSVPTAVAVGAKEKYGAGSVHRPRPATAQPGPRAPTLGLQGEEAHWAREDVAAAGRQARVGAGAKVGDLCDHRAMA